MKALVFTIRCHEGQTDNENCYQLALGQDRRIHPVSEEMIEKVETLDALVELGFDRNQMVIDDDCLWVLERMGQERVDVICKLAGIPLPLRGTIVFEWINRYPQRMDFFKRWSKPPCPAVPEILHFVRQSFVERSVPSAILARAKKTVGTCANKKSFLSTAGMSTIRQLDAIDEYVQMAVATKKGHDRVARQKALSAAENMKVSLSKRSEYRCLPELIVKQAVADDQTRIALELVDQMNAWTMELL